MPKDLSYKVSFLVKSEAEAVQKLIALALPTHTVQLKPITRIIAGENTMTYQIVVEDLTLEKRNTCAAIYAVVAGLVLLNRVSSLQNEVNA